MTTVSLDQLGDKWIAAFNSHDLDRILSYYADEVELTSPVFLAFTQGRSATAHGKPELAEYFSFGLAKYPDLTFSRSIMYLGHSSICVCYQSSIGDCQVCEFMEVDEDGKIVRVYAHHAKQT